MYQNSLASFADAVAALLQWDLKPGSYHLIHSLFSLLVTAASYIKCLLNKTRKEMDG